MKKADYRQLSCRDACGYCDFVARARTDEEVLLDLFDHLCQAHDFCEIIAWDTEEKWRAAIKKVVPAAG